MVESGKAFGRYVFSLSSDTVRRFDPETATSIDIGKAPAPIREWTPIGNESVVVAGSDTVWRLDAGHAGPTWSLSYAPYASGYGVKLAADANVTLLKDGRSVLRVWNTQDASRPWQVIRASLFAVVPRTGGVLRVQSKIWEGAATGAHLLLLDASTGSVRWRAPLLGNPLRLGVGGNLAVVWEGDDSGEQDVVAAYDLRDGRRLWARDFHEKNQWLTGNNMTEYVVATDGSRVFLRNRTTLLGLSTADGHTLWTLPFAQRPDEAAAPSLTEHKLVAVDGGSVWWIGELVAPSRMIVARLVDRDGTVRVSPPSSGDREAPMALQDGTLLVHPPYASFLEIWAPR